MFSLKNLWAEFKAFAFKGNMIDLAVAVVIGAAFSGVIKSLVDDIIMPSVIYSVMETKKAAVATVEKASAVTGIATQPSTQPTTQPTTQPGEAVAAAATPPAPPAAPTPAPAPKAEEAKPEKAVELDWKIGPVKIGAFLGELLNFVIIAFAVFIVIVKLLGSVMKKMGGTPKPEEPTTKECPECLSVIPLKARRCSHCTAVLSAASTTA